MSRRTINEALEAHCDKLIGHLLVSENTAVALCSADGTIQATNEAFIRLMAPRRDLSGFLLKEVLLDVEENGKEFDMDGRVTTGIPFLSISRKGRILFHCILFDLPDGENLFIGENLGKSDSDIIKTISVLTNEIGDMARQLKKRNQELHKANETIEELMRTDPLTGLANRRYLAERLEIDISFARRYHQPLAVIMADMDHFKDVNDTYGHAAGDRVLKGFAECLRSTTRKEDFVVRYGGEEFLVLMPNTSCFHGALFAERVRSSLAAMDLLEDGRRVTVSFGVTGLADQDTPDSLLKKADDALYKAKEAGRDRVVVWEGS